MEEIPFEDRQVPRAEIDWSRSAWWWRPLTRAIQPAVKMFALAISLLAIWLSTAGIWLADYLFKPEWNAATVTAPQSILPDGSYGLAWLQQIYFSIVGDTNALSGFQAFGAAELAFFTFVAVWLSLSFSLLGGVLARRALVELGQESVGGWGESIQIVASRWLSILWGTGMHLVGLFVLLLPVLLFGVLGRLGDIGAAIGGVLLIASFPLVFGIGRFGVSMFICHPISVCAIAAEKRADAFEGFSRSNAYVFQRPFVLVLCTFIVLIAGIVGEQIVYWTLTVGWKIVSQAHLFASSDNDVTRQYLDTGSWLVGQLLRAYWFSLFWAGSAAIYLILRKCVDYTELDELDSIESEVEATLPDIPTTPAENGTEEKPAEASTAQNAEAGAAEQKPSE